eukprot:TRINITY_DN19542_c0_g1_i1.p1 TRINITY_DN19542_c0_g1~~TRINITY_DN19542_c0_g1_i1.p1  ORF type:complete len:268 (+),score=63.89 TRINITY_DN19542_c0_g1_i1:81-884(+)
MPRPPTRDSGPVPGFVVSEHTWHNLDADLRRFVSAAGRWAAPRSYGDRFSLASQPAVDPESMAVPSPRHHRCPHPPKVEALGGSTAATRVRGLGASGLKRPRYVGLRQLFDAASADGRVYRDLAWEGLRELAPTARSIDCTLKATLMPWERGGGLYLPQLRWREENDAASAARRAEWRDFTARDWARISALDKPSSARSPAQAAADVADSERKLLVYKEAAALRRQELADRKLHIMGEEARVKQQLAAVQNERRDLERQRASSPAAG